MADDWIVAFGKEIKRRRAQLGWTQEALAAEVFGDPKRKGDISRIENARVHNPTQRTIDLLASTLNLTEKDLADLDRQADVGEQLFQVARDIPEQSPLVQFGLSSDGKIQLKASEGDREDATINGIKSELLSENGPIEKLAARYAQNMNAPQAQLLSPLVSSYRDELRKPNSEINFAVLYARGTKLIAAQSTALKQISANEWPDFEPDEQQAISVICDLHGPLIMASSTGRQIVEDAYRYEGSDLEKIGDQRTIRQLGEAISNEPELVEPDTAQAILDLTSETQQDPSPSRSRFLGTVLVGSCLSVFVGGAAWYAAGGALSAVVVPALALGSAGVVGGFIWEAMKSMPRFKKATNRLGEHFENAITSTTEFAQTSEQRALSRIAAFVERNADLFEKAANIRPEFAWAKKYLRLGSNNSDHTQLQEDIPNDFIIRNPIVVRPEQTLADALKLKETNGFSTFPVVTDSGSIAGILTNRDMTFADDPNTPISVMSTTDNLAILAEPVDHEEAISLMKARRIEKLLISDAKGRLVGLLTLRDIRSHR